MRVYDFQFRLVAWFEDIGHGPISSISFSSDTVNDDETSINMSRCLVSTKRGVVVSVDPKIFEMRNPLAQAKEVDVTLEQQDSYIAGLATHPFKHIVASAGYSGILNYSSY